MKYYGGKNKSGKEISKVLLSIKGSKTTYVEPFCGFLGVFRHMSSSELECRAYDGCHDLVILLNELKNDSFIVPDSISKDTWKLLKNDTNPSALRAYYGFGLSFNGMFFRSYAQDYTSRCLNTEVYNGLIKLKKIDKLFNASFEQSDYRDLNFESGNCLIYCDPPYTNSTVLHTGSTYKFNSEEFWNIARLWRSYGNIVVVSERSAPDDFTCIWSKNIKSSFGSYIDKLFI